MKDYYAALGIDSDASNAAVKNAYRKKAAEFHPDRNPSPDAPAQFRDAQEAYDILSEPSKRLAYDESRRRSLVENPLATAEEIWTTYLNKVLE
jgi:DnaJ-class molecular chaperone